MGQSDPFLFDCYLRPQVWGGRRLASFLKMTPPDDRPIGEAWVLSGHPLHISEVVGGSSSGLTLTDLQEEFSNQILGNGHLKPERFPWLVKFLDCNDTLSVQVHPTDELAARWIPGECGKTEAWVILDCEPGARIYAGLKYGVTRSILTKALDNGTVADCLHHMEPRPGDCIFLPAGTVHAVGGGVLMAEVQQSSDATFRLFDWNRLCADGQPRQLHRTQGLECIDWDRGPVQPQVPTRIENLPSSVSGELLVECPYFCLSRFRLDCAWQPPSTGELNAWIVLEGEIEISTDSNLSAQMVGRGGAVLIPAASNIHLLKPVEQASLLRISKGSPWCGYARNSAA